MSSDSKSVRNGSARRRLLFRLALALGLLALTLSAAEFGARTILGADFVSGQLRSKTWKVCGQYDAQLGWVNAPGSYARVRDREIDYTARINSSGYRDPERSPTPADGVQRVLVLGDSVTWGWGVDDGRRYSDLLEDWFGGAVEFINMAVPGYGTDQQFWTLSERALAFEPDAVLLCLIINDLFEVTNDRVYGMAKPRFVHTASGAWEIENRPVPDVQGTWRRAATTSWRRLLGSSAALDWLVLGRAPAVDVLSAAERNYKLPKPKDLQRVTEACDRLTDVESVTHMLLGRIQALCAREQLPLLVFNVAHKHDQYLYEPRFPRPEIEDEAGFKTYLNERLEQAAATIGFETVSLDAAMLRAVGEGHRLHCGDGHLNEYGNEVVARALEPAVRRLLQY
jgi:lysophospholipase L1-like esterase